MHFCFTKLAKPQRGIKQKTIAKTCIGVSKFQQYAWIVWFYFQQIYCFLKSASKKIKVFFSRAQQRSHQEVEQTTHYAVWLLSQHGALANSTASCLVCVLFWSRRIEVLLLNTKCFRAIGYLHPFGKLSKAPKTFFISKLKIIFLKYFNIKCRIFCCFHHFWLWSKI